MVWKKDDPAKLTQARLKILSPEAVFKELQDYDVYIKDHGSFGGNDDLEELLLARNEKLINLGLAQYATSDKVVESLFIRACEPKDNEEDESYNHALRLACLSNSNRDIWWWPNKGKWQELIDSILLNGSNDEHHALFTNPKVSGEFLEMLFAREGVYQKVPVSDWFRMIMYTSYNTRLNTDNSSYDGPDFVLWHIQKGILKFLAIAPTNEKHAVSTAHTLLNALEPSACSRPEEILPIIERWRTAEALNYKGEEQEGRDTQLSLKDELLCLIAALYGKTSKDKATEVIGKPTDQDIVLRCAYYGNADLSVNEMKSARLKDQDVFLFAAIKNLNFYFDEEKRAVLETYVGGHSWRSYRRHCEQIHKNKKWFDPNPITESGREVMEDETTPARNTDSILLEKIIAQNDALKKRIDKYESNAVWVVIIVIAALYFLRH